VAKSIAKKAVIATKKKSPEKVNAPKKKTTTTK